MPVPLFDTKVQNNALATDLQAAFARVLASGQFILGPEVQGFERQCAEYLGVRHAIGISSGTDAILLAAPAEGFRIEAARERSRAASIRVAMSARRKATAWCWLSFCPKVSRSPA